MREMGTPRHMGSSRGTPASVREYRYGDAVAQVCDLHLPGGPPRAVAVLIHGGFWRARYDRTGEHAVAADLTGRGWAVWNVDYRGVGAGPSAGGGWPEAPQDGAAAGDPLAEGAPAGPPPPGQGPRGGDPARGAVAP